LKSYITIGHTARWGAVVLVGVDTGWIALPTGVVSPVGPLGSELAAVTKGVVVGNTA
jgi:hypothetical protein